MITVGIIKELNFISSAFKTEVSSTIVTEGIHGPILIKIKNNVLDIWYENYHIWSESIEGDTAFFGVESCDTIARILASLHAKDIPHAEALMYNEKRLDKIANS